MKDKTFQDKKNTVVAIIGIVFFVVLVILVRSSKPSDNPSFTPTPTASPNEIETVSPEKKDIFESLNQRNYHFTYTIVQDDSTEIIEGKVRDNKAKFTIIGDKKEEYAKISSNYLKLEDDQYQIIKTPIRSYFPYITLENLQDILKISLKKEEDDIQTYTVDTTDLLDKYTDIEYDGFSDFKDDQIKIYENTNNQTITKIEIDYSNYFTYINENATTFQVIMEFSDFGNIEDFEI